MTTRNFLIPAAAFTLSAALMTAAQLPLNISSLAWIAMVPFISVSAGSCKTRHLIAASYIVFAGYWLVNLHWMAMVTAAGWLTFCLYTALLAPLTALSIRFLSRRRVPLYLAAAVIVTGAEQTQGLFLGGFHWLHLSHSQFSNTTLIQLADLTGAAGISFIIAAVNGLAADITGGIKRGENLLTGRWALRYSVVFSVIFFTVIYGRVRLQQAGQDQKQGPLIASIQSNVPQQVKDAGSPEADRLIFEKLLEMSSAASQSNPVLTVWPETMVPAVLNPEIRKYLPAESIHRSIHRKLQEHSKKAGYILAGAAAVIPEIMPNGGLEAKRKYNSAFLYTPQGLQSDEYYNKIHLVPFGETIPFKTGWPWIHSLLMKFTPYDYDYTLDAGSEYDIFKIQHKDDPNTTHRFGVMICYEDTIPAIARNFVLSSESEKPSWLVNISNDGWFVKFNTENGKVKASSELAQHTAACAFRAVENRISIIRSVNTGISCVIEPTGKIRNKYISGTVPRQAMNRRGIDGWFTDRIYIDRRITFFTRHGELLAVFCKSCFAAVLAIVFINRKIRSGTAK
jgi:apolipoprotein N-acyltransferase